MVTVCFVIVVTARRSVILQNSTIIGTTCVICWKWQVFALHVFYLYFLPAFIIQILARVSAAVLTYSIDMAFLFVCFSIRPSICLSVRQSSSCVVSKQLNISTTGFRPPSATVVSAEPFSHWTGTLNNVSMSVGHLDHVLLTVYSLMEHVTFDCAKTFLLSNATWKPICSNSLSPPVLHQAPLYLRT